MPLERMIRTLEVELDALTAAGTRKGFEDVIAGVVPATGALGPRYLLQEKGTGQVGDRQYLRMNANSYLGMSLRPEIIEAEEAAARTYGAGPGAVRFISGTFAPHVALEQRLAAFHGRESAMIFSSAYAAVMGVLAPLITEDTVVISDALNHNCIINAIRLSRPGAKDIYPHLDYDGLDRVLAEHAGKARRAIVVTDGIFSMRGDHADLARVTELARKHDASYEENVVVVVDDSHGVAAFGATGRGTEEVTGARADILVATLGKGLGVNGGYVVSAARITEFLREKAPLYIYSNPITPGEAAAAQRALEVVDSPRGLELLAHLRAMTKRFEQGIVGLGYETIPGAHPVVPLMVRDTQKTSRLVAHLRDHGVLATGLNFPVVPRGDESIRFQISADHTPADIDSAVEVLRAFPGR